MATTKIRYRRKLACFRTGILRSARSRAVVARGLAAVGLAGIAGALAVVGAFRKIHIIRYDFKGNTILLVFILPFAGLETALDCDKQSLAEILGHKFGGLTPCHNINEVGLTLFALPDKRTLHREGDRADRYVLRGIPQFRIAGQSSH